MRRLAAILLCLLLIVSTTSCMKSITNPQIMEMMTEISDAGILNDYVYSNPKLGIRLHLPEIDGAQIYNPKYNEIITECSILYRGVSEFDYVYIKDNKGTVVFAFRVHFLNLPQTRYRRETSEEFSNRLRNEYINNKVSKVLGEYKNLYKVSELIEEENNGAKYYKYTSHEVETGLHFTRYTIKYGDYGFRFMFADIGDEPIENIIQSFLANIEFSKQLKLENR